MRNFNLLYKLIAVLLILATLCGSLISCDEIVAGILGSEITENNTDGITITNGDNVTLVIGRTFKLAIAEGEEIYQEVKWSSSSDCVTVTDAGLVIAVKTGTATVFGEYNGQKDSITVTVVAYSSSDVLTDETVETVEPVTDITGDTDDTKDGYTENTTESDSSGVTSERESDELETLPPIDYDARNEFYGDSDPADNYEEAIARSEQGIISGSLTVPDQAPTLALFQPSINGMLIRNSEPYYADENTYVVVNALGQEVFRVYRGGGYITLEEVAAYVYAFGDVPANYVASKNAKPGSSIWGEHLRLNHSAFSGSTSKYPYEPALPRISGCGGDLYYYEIDIGTTGTDCDPGYASAIYNNGSRITRGAARIVYTRYDANRNEIIEPNEKFLFYTYNHYNDFQEYLNYYGGWGEMFGNITGGGTISSKTDYNPTEYVPIIMAPLDSVARTAEKTDTTVYICYLSVILPSDLYYTTKI